MFKRLGAINVKFKLSTLNSLKNYLIPKISSAEQSKILHNFANVIKDGSILPDKYCDKVGLDIPNSSAI